MAKKQLKIKLLPNGKIQITTVGIKGKKCLDYLDFFQALTNGKIEKQEFTSEYYEEEQNIQDDSTQNINIKE